MLNELEQDQHQKLLNDKVLVNILKKIFDGTVKTNLPESGTNESNEILGARFRAYEYAEGIIEAAFQDLESYLKIEQPGGKDINKGR